MGEVVVEAVDVALGGRRVLSDTHLWVGGGEFLGLVGPNGAGKTTLLRTLLGMVTPTRGRVRLAGLEPRHALGHIGYVPQRHEFAWDFPVSVEQVVMSGRTRSIGWLRGPRRADHVGVRDALSQVEMIDLRGRTVGELSGGQRQRVLIARALATGPAILLLDEPFTGVDLPTQELLTGLFQQLAAAGTTVLMSTHDLPAAMATCSQVALINGTVTAAGTPAELQDPQLWMDTFGVTAASPLLASIGVTNPFGQGLGCGTGTDLEGAPC